MGIFNCTCFFRFLIKTGNKNDVFVFKTAFLDLNYLIISTNIQVVQKDIMLTH